MLKLPHLFVLVGLLMSFGPSVSASDLALEDPWPVVSLPAPHEKIQRHYLGLDRQSDFSVAEIKAEFVLVQIFSMYCPICQREAARVNQLYEAIDRRDGLSGRLKIIGIGAGNSAYEVDFYRRNYGVQFPLFADGDYDIHQLLGEVRTPYFFLIQNQARGRSRIIHIKAGGFKSSQAFLAKLIKSAGLDE